VNVMTSNTTVPKPSHTQENKMQMSSLLRNKTGNVRIT